MKISWQGKASIYRNSGEMNIYGESRISFVGTSPVAVVRLVQSEEKTSVRADSSASQGRADIELTDASMIFPPSTNLKLGDVVVFNGVKLEVKLIHHRLGLRGKDGHLAVGADIWVYQPI